MPITIFTKSRRVITGAMACTAVMLVAGCVQTKKLDIDAAKIGNRPVAALRNPSVPMAVGIDVSNPGTENQAPAFAVAIFLVDASVRAATGLSEQAAKVSLPSIDPAKIVEDKLLADLAERYQAKPAASLSVPLKPIEWRQGWPDKSRIAAISSGAKAQGFDGLVLDFAPVEYEGLTQGNGLWIGGPKVHFRYAGRFALIDAGKGELLASATCFTDPQDKGHELNAVLAGGQSFVDNEVRRIADQCATAISNNVLTHP